MGPSCAVAQWQEGKLVVWTHSQGVFPLRAELAKVFDMRPQEIRCIHAEGAECYGHNGAIIQSASWTLKESVRFDRTRVTTRSWADYPILRFGEVPEVEVVLLDQPSERFLGVGEGAQGPTAAAIANALANATGRRLRALPFTPQRVTRALA